MSKQPPRVYSTVPPEEVQALKDILNRLDGTPLEREGDIVIEQNGVRYVISKHEGGYHGAVVDRR